MPHTSELREKKGAEKNPLKRVGAGGCQKRGAGHTTGTVQTMHDIKFRSLCFSPALLYLEVLS